METKLTKTKDDPNYIYLHGIKIDKRNKLPNGHYYVTLEDFIEQLGLTGEVRPLIIKKPVELVKDKKKILTNIKQTIKKIKKWMQ